MRVRYTPAARSDLEQIFNYLNERSPSGGRNVKRRIRETIEGLAAHPMRGRVVGQRPEVRRLPVVRYPYIIFFRVTTDVEILHVRHGARQEPDVREF